MISNQGSARLDVREDAEKLPNKAPELLDEMEELLQDEGAAEELDAEAANAA